MQTLTFSTSYYNYISLINQTLGFIITNVSAPYAICGSMIVMCMFATTLRNLIYKVLNLAVLSVFVVALWAYLTDVTFIYVVYILTFVSAVVMLFLSVVLMLPSSAIAVSKRATAFTMAVASEGSVVGGNYIFYSLVLVASFYLARIFLNWRGVIYENLRLKSLFEMYNSLVARIASRAATLYEGAIKALTADSHTSLLFENVALRTSSWYAVLKLHPAMVQHLGKDRAFFARYLGANILNKIKSLSWSNIAQVAVNSAYRITKFVNHGQASTFVYAESAAQAFTIVSIFCIALPSGLLRERWSEFSHGVNLTTLSSNLPENLAAIQHGLYVEQPLLLLVSITGLLVALVGAPFFVSRSSSK